MLYRLLLPTTALLLLASNLHADNEVGYVEQFALASDREAVLGQLIPGSEDYYFYHALHYQNTRQEAKLAAIMEQWAKRFRDSARRRIIENRGALLAYDADPQATLKFLRERLHLAFNHQQEARDRKPDLPVSLDPAQIARAVFQQRSIEAAENLSQCGEAALEEFVRAGTPLNPAQIRALLARLKRPDLPNLVPMIAADLKTRESRGFGEFEIHRALLPEQLDDLARRVPSLYENQAFVFARLHKLEPGADADAEYDPAEREAWLDRAWAYASKLPPAYNSLKANLLYRRLEHDRTRGLYDEARFLQYIKLPRRVPYMNPRYLAAPEQQHAAMELGANYAEAVSIALPIQNDEALVRDYFLHLFPKAGDQDPAELLKKWTPYVRDTWLKPVLAEAMITNGVGDPEHWASLLSPTAFQALKDRVDVDFALTNPPFHAPEDEVALDLFIKNSPKVIVKIYEVNPLSYFLTNQRQLNTDLPLDGLVANRETTADYSADPAGRSPFRRVPRHFAFPELKGKRGAWVIELIGGGKSSRALIRKGQWSLLQRMGAAGDLITVLDEHRTPVADAAVWLDGRKYTAAAKATEIVVPFTQQPGPKPIVLADAAGTFATLSTFQHHDESYRLDAQFHIAREQLLARREATLGVRAALLLGESMVSPGLLTESRLTITSTTLDGVSTTTEIKSPHLDPAKELTHTFLVPERLAALRVELTGKIDNLSKGGEKQQVSASESWAVNGIDATAETSDGHLSRMGPDYLYELLGRNGEPLPDRQVVFTFAHPDFSWEATIALKTDDRGRIALGPLAGLKSVHAQTPNDLARSWELADFKRTWPASIHALAGAAVRVPLPPRLAESLKPEALPREVSLLEQRAGTFVADDLAKARVEGGFLVLEGLPPGDFSLRLRDGETHEITVRVTAGQPVRDWLEGPHRALEVRDAAQVQIAGVRVGPEGIAVQLANADKFTRVHLAASRFLPEDGLDVLQEFVRFEPAWSSPDRLPSLFAAGREIGDEYRYILERRYAKLFPGNSLTRPGLLLNPWERRSTDLEAQQLAVMQQAARTAGERHGIVNQPAPGALFEKHKKADPVAPMEPDLDFLATAAPVLYNLVPDEKGVVHIDAKALGDRQQVQIYVENLTGAAWRSFALAEAATRFQDLRLARNLDPLKAFTEKKEASVLAAGQTLTLADVLTGDLETYDSLAGVHSLLTTLSGDATLAKFAWVLQWPKLSPEEQRAKYSEFACHELSFFLSRKDPAFFQKVIVPYLRNKKDRTFMDDYLLGRDLGGYLQPWAFARLNVAERALLARRLPAETPGIARHLRELWELLPPNPEQADHLFETALRGHALESDPEGFRGGKRREIEKEMSEANAFKSLNAADAPASPVPIVPGLVGKGELRADKSSALAFDGALKDNPGVTTMTIGGMISPAAPAAPAPAESSTRGFRSVDLDLGDADGSKLQRQMVRAYFRSLGPTKEWAENNYYQLPLARQGADLIGINAFWRDYAAWDGRAPFVSAHFTEAGRNFAEMFLALAVLDLPFEAPKHVTKSEGGQYSLTAAAPVVVFAREIKPAAPAKENAELLVSQNFYRLDDRYREEGNEKFDKYVTEEFLTGVVYGANIVVTNPTSTPQKLSLLLQIPQGALPVQGSKATESKALPLAPYTTQTFAYFFYFPAPSAQGFAHYPVNVSRHEESVGAAKAVTFKVVRRLSKIDQASWDYVSQYGTDDEVFAFLAQANLERLNLERIAWRARRSAPFLRRIVAVLTQRHVYSDVLYSYAVVHNETAALREWLRHCDDFLHECGPWLATPLLTIDPIERRSYEHLEYAPLVNQRTHRVGPRQRIPNPVLRGQYDALLQILAHKPTLDAMDQMSVVYYLFLQDRVEEALARFHTIQPEALPTRLQFDYFRCYAAFYEEQLPEARQLARQYADYPVDRWRKLFAEVSAQLDEIAGAAAAAPPAAAGQPDREAQQGELANTEPSFDFKVENRQIALTWRNLGAVTVNYYLMDPEFLFSSSPFVTEEPGRFSIIKPTKTAEIKLPAGQDALDLPLPEEFAKANVLVEILGAGQRKAQAYHANTLKLALTENYGRLELRDQAAGHPVSRAYVKVYARLHSGTVRFYKDGYTDLRGKFDYASLNSSEHPEAGSPARAEGHGENMSYQMLQPQELGQVERLSILIMSEAHGALVRETNPPKE